MITPAELIKNAINGDKTAKIKLLGDSITHGAGGTGYKQSGEPIIGEFRRNPDGYCWANLFKNYMESNYNCQVVNNGCSGTTIQFIVNNFDTLVSSDDDIVICMIGTNNRHRFFEEGEKPTREEMKEAFFSNILALNKKFCDASINVIFVSCIPASKANDYEDGANYWRILQTGDIDAMYKGAQKECGFAMISLYDLFLEYCKKNNIFFETLLIDGLHPNDEGYEIMYELLVNALELKNKEI